MPPSFKRDKNGNLTPILNREDLRKPAKVSFESDIQCSYCGGTGRAKSLFLKRDIKCDGCGGTGRGTHTVEYEID